MVAGPFDGISSPSSVPSVDLVSGVALFWQNIRAALGAISHGVLPIFCNQHP
jgi:hypothetical protein